MANRNPASRSADASHVNLLKGQGGLPMIQVTTPWSVAEIYLQGAHVAQFKKHDEPPLLFLSRSSLFNEGKPIRGGIPVVFPWFGIAPDGRGLHGSVRTRNWELKEIVSARDGGVTARFSLPDGSESAGGPACAVEYLVTIADTLGAELVVTNRSGGDFEFEACLHTYFTVGDINAVSVAGLNGVDYLDKLADMARKTETNDVVRFVSEVDRVYLGTRSPVEIRDGSLKRVIRIEKENSASTVVWNPWIAKARAMPDFGDEEYRQMVCVESGNVLQNKVKLAPGQSSGFKVSYRSVPLQ